MYLDNLIAKDTVNTVPPQTLLAFADHGSTDKTLLDQREDPQVLLDMLAEVGVDLDQITHQLQVDGVEAFADAFENLLDQVDAKRNVLRTGIIRQQETVLSIYAEAVHNAIEDLDDRFINMRLWEKDGSIWKGGNAVINAIRNRLGWLDVAQTTDRQRLKELQQAAGQWSHVVVLGMGGSSLAPEVLSRTFGIQEGFPQVHVLDSTNPDSIRALETSLDIPKTIFIVASKSGTTLETQAFFNYFYERTGHNGQQFIAITDLGTPLAELATEHHFYDTFVNPADIGGRYSALSYFGLVPAALQGLDLDALWASAENMMMACGPKVMGIDHPGIWLAAILGVLAHEGRDKVSVLTSPSIASMGNWIEQLLAESTGKSERGIVPVVGATIGNPHDYVTDRLFIYLRVEGDDNEAIDQGLNALQQASQPSLVLHLPDLYALGGEFFRWEYATAVAGSIIEINPFDEPNVAESKANTARLLEHFQEGQPLTDQPPAISEGGVSFYAAEKTLELLSELVIQQDYQGCSDLVGMVAAQINSTRAGDYFALLAYVPSNMTIVKRLKEVQRRLRHTTHRAVTVGYGPRYLHSTGQLHKGGANNGVFMIVTCEASDDLDIPNMPYSFGTLHAAQALGDFQSLQTHRRRVFRLHQQDKPTEALDKILAAIDVVDARRR